jgi:hypothetical protein
VGHYGGCNQPFRSRRIDGLLLYLWVVSHVGISRVSYLKSGIPSQQREEVHSRPHWSCRLGNLHTESVLVPSHLGRDNVRALNVVAVAEKYEEEEREMTIFTTGKFAPRSIMVVGAAFIKKLAGSKKKRRKFHVLFFKIGVRGPKQKLGRGAEAPPLSANVVDSLLIGNQPPWHLSLVISTSRA